MRIVSVSVLVALFSLSLVGSVFAQSEDELVNKFMQKAEKKHINKVGFIVVNGSYGRLHTAGDYNNFVHQISPWIAALNDSDNRVEGIYRSKEFFAGFGVMTTSRLAATLGFNYWLKLGSNKTGDYNLSLVNMDDPGDHNDFELKSEVQVYGFTGGLDYYLANPPDNEGILHNFALKANLIGGYYLASWNVWNGFTGYNLYLEESAVIGGKLTGRTIGGSIGISGEFPIRLAGLVVEASAKYQYLNFSNMKWYNDLDHETVAVYGDLERVDLDLSGPRAQFGLKRYFSW